jgi:hypothetical protein
MCLWRRFKEQARSWENDALKVLTRAICKPSYLHFLSSVGVVANHHAAFEAGFMDE